MGSQASFLDRAASARCTSPCSWEPGESTEVPRSQYTVKGANSARSTIIKFNTPPTDGLKILILRTVPFDQPTDITNQGSCLPELHEDSFDNRAMQGQQLDDRQLLTIRFPETYPGDLPDLIMPAPEAGKGIGWNADGSGMPGETINQREMRRRYRGLRWSVGGPSAMPTHRTDQTSPSMQAGAGWSDGQGGG